MKAAGISLLKIMRPLAFFVCGLVGVSFYFQNVVGPIAQAKLGTLILSMKQKLNSPEMVSREFLRDMPLYSVIQIQTAILFFQEPTKTRLKNRRAKLRCFLIIGNGKFRLVNGMLSKKTVKVFMFVGS